MTSRAFHRIGQARTIVAGIALHFIGQFGAKWRVPHIVSPNAPVHPLPKSLLGIGAASREVEASALHLVHT
jgi:hypothetical protein